MFRVTGVASKRTKLEIELPYTLTGEPAFDEDDKQIKGRTPVSMVLPRFNFISWDDLKQLQDSVEEVEKREVTDDYPSQQKSKDAALVSLRPFVEDDVYELLSGLCLGELTQISQEWTHQSGLPLGESSASEGTAKSTRRQSDSIS